MSRTSRPEVIAFLEDAKAHPEDDTPLLILADWLEEHEDEPRAQFIRLQCQAAKLGRWTTERAKLELESRVLENKYREEWLGPLLACKPWDISFERGLIRFTCTAEGLLPIAKEALETREAGAWVQHVRLRASGRVGPDLYALPFLQVLSGLNLDGNEIGLPGARGLAASRNLAKLRKLWLAMNQIGDVGARALAESAYLGRLHHLQLAWNEIGAEGVEALAASPHLARIAWLDLGNNRLGDAGAAALAAAPHLNSIITLILAHNRIGNEGAAALASSPYLSSLTTLILAHNQIGDAGATALAASSKLTRLNRLVLYNNEEIHEEARVALRNRFGTIWL